MFWVFGQNRQVWRFKRKESTGQHLAMVLFIFGIFGIWPIMASANLKKYICFSLFWLSLRNLERERARQLYQICLSNIFQIFRKKIILNYMETICKKDKECVYNFITVVILRIVSLPTPFSTISCSLLVVVIPVPISLISVTIPIFIIVSVTSVTWSPIISFSIVFLLIIVTIITISIPILTITFIAITIARPLSVSISISTISVFVILVITNLANIFAALSFFVIISVTTKWIWSLPAPWIRASAPLISWVWSAIPKSAQLTANVAFKITVSPILI